MRYTILISIFILFLSSCGKDKYSTTPQLKLKSLNTKELHQGETLRITLSFTDAEGDFVPDSALFVEKFEPKCIASRFTQFYKFPDFPTSKDQAGEIVYTYTFGGTTPGPQCNRNDTAVFKFVLRDKEKNKSDTVVTPSIVIYK